MGLKPHLLSININSRSKAHKIIIKKLPLFFALVGWFAVIAQFILMIENRVTPIPEAVIRFFSFYTILTNTLVSIYFTYIAFVKNQEPKSGILTAITTYIFMVGIIYQLVLRHVWQPLVRQLIVDKLLHSITPILVILFWYMYERTKSVSYSHLLKWGIYPLIYLIFILIRGSFSNFYPYPFVDVRNLGLASVHTYSVVLLLMFLMISALFLFIGKTIIKR